jgi:hypothetical protein
MSKHAGADLKIERAKEHICDLKHRVAAFTEGDPYSVVPELDPNTGKRVYRFRQNQRIPPEIALRTGEAVQNLRSALDYVVWALVDGAKQTRLTGFPIFESAEIYEAKSPGKVEGMCKDAIDAINTTKPYKGGTDPLWHLHQLNNFDKHRLLLTAGIGYRVTSQQQFGRAFIAGRSVTLPNPIVSVDLTPANAVFPVIDGAEVLVLPADPDVNPKFTFDVAFNEPEIIQREPILEFLDQSLHLVEGIVGTLGGFL